MDKNKIITAALLEMGFPFSDADSKEAVDRKAASFLFDRAVMQLLKDDCFTFNIEEVDPVLTDRRIFNGKFEYVKPDGYLCSLSPYVEERGNKLYTMKNNFHLKYKKKMDIKDIPDEYERYIALALAIMAAPTVGKSKSLERIYTLFNAERATLLPMGTFHINMEDLV